MAKLSCGVDDALARVRDSRAFVKPNTGFLSQLRLWPDVIAHGGPRRIDCELCIKEKSTKWYQETPLFIVMECSSCDLPMVRSREAGCVTGWLSPCAGGW